MILKPGDTLLNGQYRILRQLGRGGFGIVHLAKNMLLDEDVAVKELILSLAGNKETLKRFLAEAKATMRLTNKHIVRTHNVFTEGGNYYIAMEYMVGGSLEERLDKQGRLSIGPALRIATEVCEGLSYAHQEGVVHCDLKPANILFDRAGSAKVCDFGIAHVSEQMLSRTWQTRPGFIVGTLPYMSPEQIDGVRDDPRVDIYALGAVLYHVLTGRTYLDFDMRDTPGALADDVLRIRSEQPRPPSAYNPAIPSQLDRVVLRTLSKRPELRYSSADELRAALVQAGKAKHPARPKHSAQANRPSQAKGTPLRSAGQQVGAGAPRRAKQPKRKGLMRAGLIVVLLAAVTMALCMGGIYTLLLNQSEPGETQTVPSAQAVHKTKVVYPTHTPAPYRPTQSPTAESCVVGEYGRDVENLFDEFRTIDSEVVAATQAQDREQVQEHRAQLRGFRSRWTALVPPACAAAAHRKMRNAWGLYDAMLRYWLGGNQANYDAAFLEWQEAANAAVGMYGVLLNGEDSYARTPAARTPTTAASTRPLANTPVPRPTTSQAATPWQTPAAALTSLPAPVSPSHGQATAAYTAAPTADTAAAQMQFPAPALVAPQDGQAFTARDSVLLRWNPVGTLPADGYYQVTLAYTHLGETWYDDIPWLKEPQWMMSEHAYLQDLSDDGLFRWSVQVMRKQGQDAQGNATGTALSPMSEERTLIWRESGPSSGGPDH